MTTLISAQYKPTVWMKVQKNYFKNWRSALLSMMCFAVLGGIVWSIVDWGILNATFSSTARHTECYANGGACWSIIANRWRVILFGLYPYDEQWRSITACFIVVATIAFSCFPVFWTVRRLSLIWLVGAASFFVIMKGGVFGLSLVSEEQWGGLALTLFIFVGTVLIGMPLAIMLALLRNSKLPVISKVTGVIIDTVRSLPLISILFTFALVLPFMLPDMLVGEKLYRVIAASALFFAAYQAEIIRGGMQGVPKGQEEAAQALGLGYYQRITRIILPQAFKNALPAMINQFVTTFMETSLVTIVGFFELLASANAAYGTGEWNFAFVEVYFFVAAIYFAFVFALSRYGAFLERRMAN
ncbi:MAG: amino acid ABC transporter permease [Pseudomonadota bacterium]|uniref:General L-amino acid transport system permease protein n=1 Tax=Marinomonas communis TaxID=28254 RepID=A0A4V3DFZ7_9GAMM|nr:amino acid ABC transporter permease [Marinomonas communis]MEC8081575.1 amino acid ABC transporter permease [Pseudomonadota bacterium]MEC8482521.1 amino acid ABC transporter permease [Pseudomonadota bacterium]TDR12491.1 general L-amino acid transport system permease protein [Marinomonas communis]